jgi:lysyl-tRNA synthetase class 1
MEIYEPSIVRYMFAGTRPNTEFFVSFDLDVLKVYEDFDKCERIYFDKNLAKNEKEHMNQKRIYELSAVELPKKQPIQPIFRHLCNLLQVYHNDVEKVKDYYKDEIKTPFDNKRIESRCLRAWKWLASYAPEETKDAWQKTVSFLDEYLRL